MALKLTLGAKEKQENKSPKNQCFTICPNRQFKPSKYACGKRSHLLPDKVAKKKVWCLSAGLVRTKTEGGVSGRRDDEH
ncbi:hypothetical protein [uncultured Photobacterium sp.]|uniref:hypothetical protein n=1 Tax=uncultured Photobacterium sp. TaxID=173973 RepID=UPI002606EA20|nr:hypothetical protein [uncultured Photobacterium sp.]